MFRTFVFWIFMSAWFVLWVPFLFVGLISEKLSRRMIMAIAAGLLFLARVIVGVRYEIHGKIAPGAIVASKHMSMMETAILGLLYPNVFFISKKEIMMIPVYGWALWRIGFIKVDRTRGKTNMKALAAKAAHEINGGKTLVIFPEGTRAKVGAGVSLRRGLLFVAETARVPIQPVGLDTGVYWPKRGRMRPGTAHVYLEKPLPFDASLEDVAGAIARHSA